MDDSKDVLRTFPNTALNLCANNTDRNPAMNKLPIFKTKKTRIVYICSLYSCPLGFSILFSLSLHGSTCMFQGS